MFSFFRRGKKDTTDTSSNGVAHVASKRHDVSASSQPALSAHDENSFSNRSQSQEGLHHFQANVVQREQAMAPMAAARGKGKAKKNAKKEQTPEKQDNKEGKKLEMGQKNSNQEPVVVKSEGVVIKSSSQTKYNQVQPGTIDATQKGVKDVTVKENSATNGSKSVNQQLNFNAQLSKNEQPSVINQEAINEQQINQQSVKETKIKESSVLNGPKINFNEQQINQGTLNKQQCNHHDNAINRQQNLNHQQSKDNQKIVNSQQQNNQQGNTVANLQQGIIKQRSLETQNQERKVNRQLSGDNLNQIYTKEQRIDQNNSSRSKNQSFENLREALANKQNSDQISAGEATINSTESKNVIKRQPLSYSKILQRLDSIPPMSQQPQPPEKRRHSVKPCSHVTIAASPKPPPANGSLTPPGSPVAAVRTSRLAKQLKSDQEVDTVKAAMKLHIDLPTVTNICARTEEENDLRSVEGCDKKPKQDNDKEMRNLVNQETQFQKQLAELSERLRLRENEASELRIQMETVKQDLYVKSSGCDRLQAELSAAHKDSESVRQKLKRLQDDVQQYKQKNADMVEEVQKKTDEYKSLEQVSQERTASLEASVKDLTEKLSNLESQISSIREERDRLEKRRAELETEREEEKKIVQEALDAATSENETIRRRWEQDFEKLRTVNTDREQQMLDDFEWKLREVQAACKKRLEEKDKQAELKIKEAQRHVDKKIKEAESQMNEVQHLRSYEAEVTQLRGLTHDQQHSLRTMSARVEELQTTEQNLHEEINRLHASLEFEKREQLVIIRRHEKDLADKERALQIRLEKQRGEVAVQWEQKLRQECARLTAELEQMHNDEKQLAVELVKVQKDREFDTVKEQWERKLQLSLEEIEDLRNTLSRKDDKHHMEIERLRTNADRDIVELRRELDKSEMAYYERTEKMLEEHTKELDRINEEAERRIKDIEQTSQMQMSSMRTTLELVKEQAVREADERIQKLQNDHQRAKDELWRRLTDDKEQEILRIEEEYKNKFEKIKEQFTIVQKSHQNKEQDLLGKINNLTGEITDKSSTIESLQNNVDTLHGGVQVLRQEIVHQDQTLNKVKAEAEQKIGELQHALKVERDTLHVEREEHIEEITHIQKQAQANFEQLQRRCTCLTKLFEDMRTRYDKRESRPEDVNLIADLRAVIAEQERDLAVLNEEKRYFQMKLMKHNSSGEESSSPAAEQWKDGEENLSNSNESLESTEELEDTIEQIIPG